MHAGIVITKEPVDTYVPLYVRDESISTQYIMTTLEELGLLKMDFLGLRTLTVIEDAIELVKESKGIDLEFDKDMKDEKAYKLWSEGRTIGIFQFESAGITKFMKELKPDSLEDIIAGVSLYRPGPMDQIPRYIQNKLNPENEVYTHPSLKPILNVTYGCMVYQEQVMQIVRELAGYSLGRADLVRRAMGKKKLDVMAKERECFIHGEVDESGNIIIPGCVRNGIDEEAANKIFDEMAEFAKYAFNKSHAAAYAVVAYRTAYIKAYYPEALMAATLNSYLGNLDKVPMYIDECRELKIEILKPDINKSFTKFTIDKEGKIRFGLGSVKNVGIQAVENIISDRKKNGPYSSFTEFCERVQEYGVNKKCIESLIKAGAFDNFEQTRKTLIESFEEIIDTIQSGLKRAYSGQVSMFDLSENKEENEKHKYVFKTCEEYTDKELLSMEKEMLGIYLSGHPLRKLKQEIIKQTNIDSNKMKDIASSEEAGSTFEYKDGQIVKYAGVITSVKKKFTKNNKIMAFVTVEDLYGQAEIIVFENCYLQIQDRLMEENIVLVTGRLSIKEDDMPSIVATNIEELSERKERKLKLDIRGVSEQQKEKLRGALRFFMGDRNNVKVEVIDEEGIKPSGAIFLIRDTVQQFKEILRRRKGRNLEIKNAKTY